MDSAQGVISETKSKLQITSLGSIPSGLIEELRGEIEECYRRLSIPGPDTVELRLIDTVERLGDLMAKEKAELGIATSGDEGFLATHDAWRGVPRVTVCVGRMMGLPDPLRLGVIRHEAAHALLHGSLEYYVFRLSRDVLVRGRARGIETRVLQQLFYYVSIAVKDCEVTRLLANHGYMECQAALALHQLEVADEDKLAWQMARWDPQARLVYLTAQLKPLLFAHPLLRLPTPDEWSPQYRPQLVVNGLTAGRQPTTELKSETTCKGGISWRDHLSSQRIDRGMRMMLGHLPPEEGEKLLDLTDQVASRLGEDTHCNIEMALRLVLETL